MTKLDLDRALRIPLDAELVSDERWKQMAPERERDTGADVYPLDDFDPGWWLPTVSELRWVRNARALVVFRREHGRWPSTIAKAEVEKILGQWLQTQRTFMRLKKLHPDRKQYLDQVLPGWEVQDFDEQWQENADALVAFRREHGRWPRRRSSDEAERALYKWLGRQRRVLRDKKLRSDRKQHLDRVLPGWEGDRRDNDAVWQANADALVVFRAEHGRWPRSNADDEAERALYKWLSKQRWLLGKDKLRSDRKQYLDRVLPGWEQGHDFDAQWQANADALVAFREEQDRWPSSEADDEAERTLYSWLSKQRRLLGKDKLRSDRKQHFDQVSPGWEQGYDAIWQENADALVAFLAEHGRWPRQRSDDEAERALYSWLSKQRWLLGKDKLRSDRRQHLDQVLPGWESSRR